MNMDGKERRQKILEILKGSPEPVTGTALAKELSVSRQVIVGDMAILRAAGLDIMATPQGYLMPAVRQLAITAKVACRHGKDNLADELATIVDNGGKVLDVIVEHGVYGEIKANLMLASRRDITLFLEKLMTCGAEPLSIITGGVHLHTIEAPSQEVLDQIIYQLKERGLLLT